MLIDYALANCAANTTGIKTFDEAFDHYVEAYLNYSEEGFSFNKNSVSTIDGETFTFSAFDISDTLRYDMSENGVLVTPKISGPTGAVVWCTDGAPATADKYWIVPQYLRPYAPVIFSDNSLQDIAGGPVILNLQRSSPNDDMYILIK
jgi:hypothetical protein